MLNLRKRTEKAALSRDLAATSQQNFGGAETREVKTKVHQVYFIASSSHAGGLGATRLVPLML